MFLIPNTNDLREMGFVRDGVDYVARGKTENGGIYKMFTVYKGSNYLRYSKTAYATDEQLKKIYEWTKKNYIVWEED